MHDNYIYRSNFRRQGVSRNIYYWECINNRKGRCRGRLKTIGDKLYVANSNGMKKQILKLMLQHLTLSLTFLVPHNHEYEASRLDEARSKGLVSLMSLNEAAKEYDEKASMKIEMLQEDGTIPRNVPLSTE